MPGSKGKSADAAEKVDVCSFMVHAAIMS